MCRDYLEKAWDAKDAKNYLAAEQHYLACLKCDPENAVAGRELGLMYWARFQRTSEAIQLIEKSLLSQDCADGHLFLAMVNQAFDRPRALIEFQLAIDSYKKESDATGLMGHAYCYYARLLAQDGKLIEAEGQFLEALRVNPGNEDLQRMNAHFQKYLRETGQHPSLSPE